MSTQLPIVNASDAARIRGERRSQRVVTALCLAGLYSCSFLAAFWVYGTS